ncbi:MAG: hypothetical protein AAF429_09375 [Pseudomonadota bacterium]
MLSFSTSRFDAHECEECKKLIRIKSEFPGYFFASVIIVAAVMLNLFLELVVFEAQNSSGDYGESFLSMVGTIVFLFGALLALLMRYRGVTLEVIE